MRIAYVITRGDAVGGATMRAKGHEVEFSAAGDLDRPGRQSTVSALRRTAVAIFRKLAFLVIVSRKAGA